MELSPFVFFTFILITALLAMVALKIIRAPTIPAYFLAGLFVGPNGVGILHSSESVYFAGELGIVLLLFSIGLKFSISSLHAIRHFVFVLGTLQVALTAAIIAIPAWFFLDDLLLASLVGFVAAMSSTAIVSQLLLTNNSVASPVGRRAIGVLLLQDLVVIPLIIIYSNEGGEYSLAVTTLILIAKIATVLFLVLRVAPNLMQRWLNWAARYGDKELFIVNIVAIISLFSMLTGVFGLSYVLGAFLAGILIAETFHRHRVEQIVEPFQQLFLGFFFITLGILIDPKLLAENIFTILLLTIILLTVKFFVLYVGMNFIVKTHKVTNCRTAFLLSGGGEFGFVLLAVATDSALISDELFQLLVPVNILAMIIVPIFWGRSEKLIRNIFPADWLSDAQRITKNMASTQHLQDHIIICGFGRTGQAIAGVLRTVGAQSFVVLEEDHVILNAVGNAEQVIYGSSDRSESLLAAGILRAKALIVTYVEPVGATLSIQNARKINPKLYIIAKALTVRQAKMFSDAGADEVLVEAHESGFSLAEKTLRRLGNESVWMLPHALEGARSGKNPLFLAQYMGTRIDEEDNSNQLVGCRVSANSKGVQLKDLPEQVKVVALRRGGVEINLHGEECMLLPHDQLILLGADEHLEQAKKLLNE